MPFSVQVSSRHGSCPCINLHGIDLMHVSQRFLYVCTCVFLSSGKADGDTKVINNKGVPEVYQVSLLKG